MEQSIENLERMFLDSDNIHLEGVKYESLIFYFIDYKYVFNLSLRFTC